MSNSSGNDNEVYVPSQAREWQEGNGHRPNQEVLPHAGVIKDPKVRRALTLIFNFYDPYECKRPDLMPEHARDLDIVRKILAAHGTETLTEAIGTGDIPQMRHMMGDTTQRADISGVRAIDDIDDLIDVSVLLWYIYGFMGKGKSSFAMFTGERWKRYNPTGEIGSNIRDFDAKDEWIDSYGTLDQWLKEKPDTPKLFIFDEANSHAGGHGRDGHEAKTKLGPMIYKIRKWSGNMIIIGHDGKDITPLVRELATIVHKEGTKDASFYQSIRNRNPEGIIQEVTGIPDTRWDFNDEEATDWSWEDYREIDNDEHTPDHSTGELARETAIYTVIRGKQQGMTNEALAEFVPFSDEWVRLRWKDYDEHGKYQDIVGKVEDTIK
ncbi:hypothetical protein [Natrialbaceae archaeon AArc-T1-2]|uniref:hypothetical protein n=1 Tax=Natrialbaceae archaeon AArc-T1-2 TaxID=3053904 RepID=UPI00255B0C98|nr:hypothetical protein [Natrialbaceae archaeon AArc-T1-2]WIV66564.1 hypothetical protein QQ977_12805 [Natrialbaceae archaeon AArc-T1-2]